MLKNSTGDATNAVPKPLDNSSNNYYDIVAMLFIFSILAIEFIPQLGSVDIIAPQYLYLSFINIITSLFIYNNPNLISYRVQIIFKNSWIIRSYFFFLFLCFVSIFSANNFSLAVTSIVQLSIVCCLIINLTVLLHDRLKLIYSICFLVGIEVFIRSFISISDFINVARASDIVTAIEDVKGNTGNINIFSASLTAKVPFLLLGIVHFSKWKRWFLSITFLMATFLILLIAARASYISLFLILVGFVSASYFINRENKSRRALLYAIVLPLITSFLIANFVFKKSESMGRYSSVTNRVLQLNNSNGTDYSINLRLKYWENAFAIAKSNPIFGIGLGNWKTESIPYEDVFTNRLRISNHTHNDFLEVAAETGILNFAVFISLFIFVLFKNIKNCSSKNEETTRIIALLALLVMASYGIDALFNFPMYRPTNQINFCLFIVLTILNSDFKGESDDTESNKKLILAITAVSLIGLYFSYTTLRAYQFENDVRADLALGETNYNYSSKEIITKIPKFPNVAINAEPFVEMAGLYALKEKNYPQAIKYFNESQKINPYTGRAEWYKYRIYKELGIADSARYYAKKAFAIKPLNEEYYLSALVVAAKDKDTITILKTHKEFLKYSQKPSTWINTSSALAQSQYPNKKIIEFINSGLSLFPSDSTLTVRKKSFENDAINASKSTAAETISGVKIDNNILASQYAAKLNFAQAILYFKKAALEDPNNIITKQNIGICYFKINDFKSAIIYLEKTLNSPLLSDGKTEYLLGSSYFNTNNKTKGCMFLKIAENKKYPGAATLVSQYCK